MIVGCTCENQDRADFRLPIFAELKLSPQKRRSDIRFHGQDILPGNWLFKHLILKPDTKAGTRSYEANCGKEIAKDN